MFNTFNIEKTMFKDQFYERSQFSLNYEENTYKGIYYKGEITWFYPQPLNKFEEDHVNNMEEEVHKRMQEQISIVNNFEIENNMFEGQYHERDQFSLNFAGNTFKGIYHNGEITWFHPHPQQNLQEDHVNHMEEEIHKKMQVSFSL